MARQSEPAVREGAGREGPSELWVAGPSAREPRRVCGLVKSGSAACHGSAGRGRPKPLLQIAEWLGPLFQVLGEGFVYLEHCHPVLPEHGLELLVRHDLALVLRVLELVRLDVVPNLAHHLSTGQRL